MKLFIRLSRRVCLCVRLAFKAIHLKDGEYFIVDDRYDFKSTNFEYLRGRVKYSNFIGDTPNVCQMKCGAYVLTGASILGGKWVILCRPNKDNKEERKFFESIE